MPQLWRSTKGVEQYPSLRLSDMARQRHCIRLSFLSLYSSVPARFLVIHITSHPARGHFTCRFHTFTATSTITYHHCRRSFIFTLCPTDPAFDPQLRCLISLFSVLEPSYRRLASTHGTTTTIPQALLISRASGSSTRLHSTARSGHQ